MNIIEAIMSGEKFTRPGWHRWYQHGTDAIRCTRKDIVATDWLIEEQQIDLTIDQIKSQIQFIENTIEERFMSNDKTRFIFVEELAKAIGFK